jgi:hypothetical protein
MEGVWFCFIVDRRVASIAQSAEQSVQPEPRAARFLKSKFVGRGPVNRGVMRQD